MNRLLFSFYFTCCVTILSAQEITDIEMVFVEGGTFTMGCTEVDGDCYGSEKPLHEVKLGNFSIGRYEVTQAQWEAVMGYNPSLHQDSLSLPVEYVSWNDVQDFIRKLNKLTGKQYRLPTEAEWEYAARGGNKSLGYKYSGSNDIDEIAWHDDNSGLKTHPVGGRNPNELGIYDMSGNVYEWCEDGFNFNFYQKCKSQGVVTNPKSPVTSFTLVIRGGSCTSYSWDCRVSVRGDSDPDARDGVVGFRLASSSK